MDDMYFTVTEAPQIWADARHVCHGVVTMSPWEHSFVNLGGLIVTGRRSWGAHSPIWRNEVIYYNIASFPLERILDKIVVHHTNNTKSILQNENTQQARGYAALGYHFFIHQNGGIYEGRPLEIMGSHAGAGKISGPLNDPDWGAIGIVLQGDYHHADEWFFSANAPTVQLASLEKLILALKHRCQIHQLLTHSEIERAGESTVCPGDHMASHLSKLRSKLKMRAQ